MSQKTALLQAIHAEPGDAARRLVYADLLMGEGDPRGTFITQQCRLDGMDPLDADYPLLRASTERLRATHAVTWLAPLFEVLDVPEDRREHALRTGRWTFERGFLSRLAMDIETASRVAGELARLEPLDGMTLLVSESIPDAQRSFPEISGWRQLGVEADGWFTDYSVAHVLGWGLPQVSELSLAKCSLGVSGCQLLANEATDLGQSFDDYVAPPPLPIGQLRALDLRGCAVGDAGLEVLARAPTLAALETLDLTQNRLTEPSLESLRKAAVFDNLSALSLAGNNELGPHLGRLAGWPPIARLRRLALPQTTTLDALTALFPQPSAKLRELVLTSNKALATKPELLAACAEHLTHVDLGTTRIGDAGLATLLASSSGASLTALKLNGCSLSDKAIAALVSSNLERLTELDLSSNKLTNAALEQLAAWPGLRHVTRLRLANNRKLSHDGYAALARSPYFEPFELLLGKVADEATRAAIDEWFGDRASMNS
ncbi:TIGR02996 domain-containing protein [Enhygromyxa salina]|uniref:Leucine Rich repeat protein n=1 Tax=Enhygromyxa salina TaxID=215803 RepID=A0A2S9YF80_9BACT|nr:TIGR02996 domain-containing protein [Enhygromyxa salina]PRQ03768.1 Leucine Rich repeat protein [Enhygromyxa salina]